MSASYYFVNKLIHKLLTLWIEYKDVDIKGFPYPLLLWITIPTFYHQIVDSVDKSVDILL